jgi:TM2 domain-containing membrane protein YozV
LHKSAKACPKCGAVQAGVIGQKSRVTAALLAFFLGGFGVHKFYLGRIVWGIVYLVFFWTFIPAIVAFIEFIIYLTMTDEAFTAKYG